MNCCLKAPGWNEPARGALTRLIERGSGRGLPVAFDFDNTLISGDVGEAVLAALAGEGRLGRKRICPTLAPELTLPGRRKLALEDCLDLMQYYEAFLAPTVHGRADPAPLANGYIWATEVLEGLTVADVCAATARVYALGRADPLATIEAASRQGGYPAPRFREEMVELIGQFLRHRYTVRIVSASNVWSVRWLVLHGLNPLLKAQGFAAGLRPEHVIGVATLLADRAGHFYKDAVLVRQNSRYAALDLPAAKALRITRHLQFPVPVYSGKVACMLDGAGCNPYLCAGDSPSDHALLRASRHRLWIARPDKPQAQRATRMLIQETGPAGWIIQAVGNGGDFDPGNLGRSRVRRKK